MKNIISPGNFTSKQVFILVLLIVGLIAFFETNSWKDFGLKFIMYGVISEFAVVFFGAASSKK